MNFASSTAQNELRGILRFANEHADWRLVLLWNRQDGPGPVDPGRLEADGLITDGSRLDAARLLRRFRAPVAWTGRPEVAARIRSRRLVANTLSDDASVARLAADHLESRGFRHFAFVGEENDLPWSRRRLESFRRELSARGFSCEAYPTLPPKRRRKLAFAQRNLASWLARLPRRTRFGRIFAMNYVFIGAHPDDPDLLFGGTALKLVRMGHKVLFVALCNGDAGHYTGSREALAARRFGESRAAAAFLELAGYEVFDTHDGCVRADLPTRERLIRLLRRFAPDVVVSHWLHDYHADHRATAQVVQDTAYLLNVPLYCQDVPAPPKRPVYAWCWHRFTDPRPFRPGAAVEFDSVYDEKCRLLDCHASQFYEWLPWSEGLPPPDPAALSWEGKKAHLGHWLERFRAAADAARDALVGAYGEAGRSVRYAEAFEQTPYGRQVSPDAFRLLFAGRASARG